VVWWSIYIKLWWHVGVFPLNFAKFNGNTPPYHQSLMEILSISIKLWWYAGAFPLNFGGMVEYFH
jgi:hypothetical protein